MGARVWTALLRAGHNRAHYFSRHEHPRSGPGRAREDRLNRRPDHARDSALLLDAGATPVAVRARLTIPPAHISAPAARCERVISASARTARLASRRRAQPA